MSLSKTARLVLVAFVMFSLKASAFVQAANFVYPYDTDVVFGEGIPLATFLPLPDSLLLPEYDLTVGMVGSGYLEINDGSTFVNRSAFIGVPDVSHSIVWVHGAGSSWSNNAQLMVGLEGHGAIHVSDGATLNSEVAVLAVHESSSGFADAIGAGAVWNNSTSLTVGAKGHSELSIYDGGLVLTQNAIMGDMQRAHGFAYVSGENSTWNISDTNGVGELTVGNYGHGTLEITYGGSVLSSTSYVGREVGGQATVTIDGPDSVWDSGDSLTVSRGELSVANQGSLFVNQLTMNGGILDLASNGILKGDAQAVSNDFPIIICCDSQLMISYPSSVLDVELAGSSTLNLTDGGKVYSVSTTIGGATGRTADNVNVTISGLGSHWRNTGDFYVGRNSGEITIADSGLLEVLGTTTIDSRSRVQLNGGKFRFGETSIESFTQIQGDTGRLAGTIILDGPQRISTLPTGSVSDGVDVSEVSYLNQGYLPGYGDVRYGLTNGVDGELRTTSDERTLFEGRSKNRGLMTVNSGSQLRFGDQFTNSSGGEIDLREGELVVDGRFENDGVIRGRGVIQAGSRRAPETISNIGLMEFNGGFSEVYGEVSGSGRFYLTSDPVSFLDSVEIPFLPGLGYGRIDAISNANVSFYDEVNSSDIYASYGSSINFLGGLRVRSGVAGKGHVFIDNQMQLDDGGFVFQLPDDVTRSSFWIPLLPDRVRVSSVEFEGSLEFGRDANMLFDLEASSSRSDFINVVDTLILDGTLELNLANLEYLTPNETFTLFTAGEILGEFDTVLGLDIDSPLELELIQTDQMLQVMAILPGDFNNDWVVDAADYTFWRDQYGSARTARLQAEGAAQYATWAANYGASFGGGGIASAQAIPEPSSMLLLFSGLAVMARCKRAS